MSIYYIDISSHFSIEEVTQVLQDEENLYAEFKDSRVVTADDLSVVNHAKFEECDPRPIKPVIIVKEGAIPPTETEKFWSGILVIANSMINVEAYR